MILSNANEFTESPRPTTNLIQYIGGINVHPPEPLSNEVDSLLSLRPSTVLFSFGTYIKGCQMPLRLKQGITCNVILYNSFKNSWRLSPSFPMSHSYGNMKIARMKHPLRSIQTLSPALGGPSPICLET